MAALGVRAGAPIKCNRQLLVANAFEEWLEQHLPALHRQYLSLEDRKNLKDQLLIKQT